jgi:hypothetical protein
MARFNKFRVRIFWSLVPIFCVLLIFISFVDFYEQKRLAEDELSSRAKSMAENLAYSTRLGVLTEDKRLLEAALQSVTGAADFAYVWVYGEQQRPLIQFFGKLFDAKHVIADFPNNKRTRIYDHGEILLDNFVLGNQRYVEYIAPVISDYSNTPYSRESGPYALDYLFLESTRTWHPF